MAKKRYNLLSVVNRLHVENAISLQKADCSSQVQVGLQNFVNSCLLQSKKTKDELITVLPDEPDQEKCKVVLTKKGRKSGGNFVCAKCGHRIFKLYSKNPEASSNVSFNISTQLQKRATESLNVCWKCSTIEDRRYQRKYVRSKVRPLFDRELHGVTSDRASKSWHFIRRDFVSKKINQLIQQKCNENEYAEQILSDISNEDSQSSDSDGDDDSDESGHSEEMEYQVNKQLPFQLKTDCDGRNIMNKSPIAKYHDQPLFHLESRDLDAYEEHVLLLNDSDEELYVIDKPTNIECKSDNDPSPVIVKRPNCLENSGILLDSKSYKVESINLASAVSKHKDLSTLPLPIEVGVTPADSSVKCIDKLMQDDNKKSVHLLVDDKQEYIYEMQLTEDKILDVEYAERNMREEMLEDIDSKIEILSRNSEAPFSFSEWFTPCLHNTATCDDVCFCFDDKPAHWRTVKKAYDRKVIKKIPKGEKKAYFHKGVCRLVTAINRKKSHYVDNSFNTCLYDSNGIFQTKRDLPFWMEERTRKSKKKVIDTFLSQHDTKHHSTIKISGHEDNISNKLTLEVLTEKTFSQSQKSASNIKVPDQKSASSFKVPDQKSASNIKVPDRKSASNIKVPDRKSASNIKVPDGKVKRPGPPPLQCAICKRFVNKSAVSYTQDNAPLKYLMYFKGLEDKIRLCEACLSPFKSNKVKLMETKKVCVERCEQNMNGKRPAKDVIKMNSPVKLFKTSQSSDTKLLPGNPSVKAQNNSMLRKFSTKMLESKFIASNAPTSVAVTESKVNGIPVVTMSNVENAGGMKQTKSPESHLGSSLGRLNLKVVKNPNHDQLQSIAQNLNTKYVIVQTSPHSSESKVQKLCTAKTPNVSGGTKAGNYGDITINGQKFKIDSEFKLNNLVKDNENAILSVETQNDILKNLPSILKRTMGTKAGVANSFRIINFTGNSLMSYSSSNTSASTYETLPLSSLHVRRSSGQSILSTPPQVLSNTKPCVSSLSLSENVIVSASKTSRVCLDSNSESLSKSNAGLCTTENSIHSTQMDSSHLPVQHQTFSVISSGKAASLVNSWREIKPVSNSLLPSISRQIQQQIRTSTILTPILQPQPVLLPIQNEKVNYKTENLPVSHTVDSSDRIKIIGRYLTAKDLKKSGMGSSNVLYLNNAAITNKMPMDVNNQDAAAVALTSIRCHPQNAISFSGNTVMLKTKDTQTGAVISSTCIQPTTVNNAVVTSNAKDMKTLVVISHPFDLQSATISYESKGLLTHSNSITSYQQHHNPNLNSVTATTIKTNMVSSANSNNYNYISSNVNMGGHMLFTQSQPIFSTTAFHSKPTTHILEGSSTISSKPLQASLNPSPLKISPNDSLYKPTVMTS